MSCYMLHSQSNNNRREFPLQGLQTHSTAGNLISRPLKHAARQLSQFTGTQELSGGLTWLNLFSDSSVPVTGGDKQWNLQLHLLKSKE